MRLAWCLGLLAAVATGAQARSPGQNSLDRGARAFAEGSHREAVEAYSDAVRLDSKLTDAYVGRAKSFWLMGELEQAAADFKRAIGLEPERADLYVERGETLGRTGGDPTAALADFDQAIRLDPKNARAHACRGFAMLKLMNTRQAMIDFETALALDPNLSKAYVGRGVLYRDLNQPEKAIAEFATAQRIDPGYIEVYLNRSNFYRNQGEYRKAFDDLQTGLAIAPKSAAVHGGLAWLAAVCPDPEIRNGKLALTHARIAYDLTYGKDPGTIATLAAAHAEAGDFAEAVRWQERYLDFDIGEVRKAAGRDRLALYAKKQPYRALSPFTASVPATRIVR